ncbi:hypothetical protein XI00_25480 [Bradyrhizobium sp. CCBAU 21359]|nr:hypothetical protein [Bradyrhizobium sp. CCBAU 21360]MDA9457536.1 hypothetical protein [Bradyrhizobium sp. CCBAU 21359]
MAWDWKKTAAEAQQKLAAARHGEREAVLRAAGGMTDVNTVRRAVAALGFLDRLKAIDRQSHDELKDSSFGVVELFARWWPINATDAKAGLSKWKKGELTTRGLAASMRESRRPTVAKTSDESLPPTYYDYVESHLLHGIETLLGQKIRRSEDKPPPHRRVHLRYKFKDSFDGRDREVVAIVVGPYQNQSLYRKKRNDSMLKALGLANFVDWVFIVVPSGTASEDYNAWLDRAKAEIGLDHSAYGTPLHPIARLKILVIQ